MKISLFTQILQRKGFPVNQASILLKQQQQIQEHNYAAFLEKKKAEIVRHHSKENANYKHFIGNTNISEWNNIPIMTKKDFQKPLSLRLSKGYSKNNVYINKTSGSSGDPFFFAKDKFCHALTWANIIDKFGAHGIDFNTSFQARFYGIPLDFKGNLKERIKDFFSNRYRFSVFDLSDAYLEKVLKKFSTKKFDYINGYTSSIVQFAKYLNKKNIVLKDVCPTLKCCIVTSEMLFEEDKILLETQFGVCVINEYGASELDLIAFQNPNGEWQINTETLFVEIVDEKGNVLPNGEEGRIVITSLYNKAHPFIRYDIGDMGILDEKSTAKNTFLKKLTGRTNDIAVLPSGKKAAGLTFYYITKSIIEDTGNVKEFVIKQTKIDTFEIEYVSELELNASQVIEIEKAMTNYLEKGLKIHFYRKEKLTRSPSGKLKQFTSLVKQ